jgi:hypothetical protein
MVINQKLPLGLIANTAAVLAVSVGNRVNDIVGEDVLDKDDQLHRGITQVSIPLLKGDDELIRSIRDKLLTMATDDLFYVDFCDVAQKSKHYDEYKTNLRKTPADNLNYLGIAIYGPPKQVNKLTGHIGLLR